MARQIADQCAPGVGFALLLFDLGSGGSIAYMSNARREQMVQLLKELTGTLERSG
jgi:hypothetical protein